MCTCGGSLLCDDCHRYMAEMHKEFHEDDVVETCISPDPLCCCDKCWQAHLDSGDADWFFGSVTIDSLYGNKY